MSDVPDMVRNYLQHPQVVKANTTGLTFAEPLRVFVQRMQRNSGLNFDVTVNGGLTFRTLKNNYLAMKEILEEQKAEQRTARAAQA
ncbi:hypothetical protein BGZ98_006674, partial [Dissophora globulifera]